MRMEAVMRTNPARLALLLLPFAACSTMDAIGGAALEAGRNMLVDKAQANYGPAYTSDLGKMLDILMVQNLTGAEPAQPAEPAEEPTAAQPDPAPEPAAEPAEEEPPPPPPLELELTVVREVVLDGRPTPIPVEDGAVLRDGVGREGDGDNLKIRFRVNQDCHVYGVWIDATAWATPVFPVGPGYGRDSLVEAGEAVSVPEGKDWFYLDGYRGVENLYFVASREPLPELDELLRDLAGRERPLEPAEEVEPVEEEADLTRGIGGVRPGAQTLVEASDGTAHEVATQAFVAQLADGDLVVSRWFRHE